MALTPGSRLGPYEVLAPLGAGGMGEVFRARDTRLGRDVAIKVVPDRLASDPKALHRFETEAKAVAALSHPNILALYDVGEADGIHYAVTELLEGETLRALVALGPAPAKLVVEIARELAEGLAAAHEKGIVHRDLKPDNVFLTKDGHAKILDFGVAKLLPSFEGSRIDTETPTESATQPGSAVGTVTYMSPEQIRGQAVDARSDLFSLGVVLYEMLSGKRPFQRDSSADTMSAILHEEPPPLAAVLPSIPPELERIVTRCLEKKLADRLSSAHDLALSLRAISTDQHSASRSGERPRPVRRPGKAAAAAFAGSALLVAAAVLGLLLKWPRTSAGAASARQTWGSARQITSAPGWDAEPAISPDGTLVSYTSNASGSAEVWVVDPDGGEPLRLTDDPARKGRPTWFPDGRAVAFAAKRDSPPSVWKVSRLGGSASLLLENGDMPAISPDGTRIAFVRSGPTGLSRIWVAPIADPSRAERVTGEDGGEWEHSDPAWSPDGTLLCYSAFSDLWLVPAAGGKARRLTHDGEHDRRPTFSPDGSSVLFGSSRSNPVSIWKVALHGGAPERILPGTGTASQPSLSRDGRRLVFSTAVTHFYVAVTDRKTGATWRIVSSRDDQMPAMAPDGSAIAYCSNRLGTDDLWLEPIDAGRTGRKPPRRLTSLSPGPATPTFSPDGGWIAFFRNFNGHRDLWAVPLNGGAPRALVEGRGDNIHPAYSPDGSRLAFVSDRSGHEQVWILPIRAGQPAGEPWRLTDGDVTDAFPAWSPDGGRIGFVRNEEVWITDARPGAEPRRTTSGAEASALAWEPDGTALLVSGFFGTGVLHVRQVRLPSATSEPLQPHLVLGDQNAGGCFSISRDGRFLAAEVTESKGNLWITSASRDGR